MNTQARLSAGFPFSVHLNQQHMTPVEIRAAHRINAALLKQTREKMRDQQQNLAKAEAWTHKPAYQRVFSSVFFT